MADIPHEQPQFAHSTPIRKVVSLDKSLTPTGPHQPDPIGRAYFRQPLPEELCVAAEANSSQVDYNEASNVYDEYALEQEDSFFKAWCALMSHLPFSTLSHSDSDSTKLARQSNRDRARYMLCVLSTCLQAEPWEQVVFPKTHLFDSLIVPYPDGFKTDLDRTLAGMCDLGSEDEVRRIYAPTPQILENLHNPLFNESDSNGARLPQAGADKQELSSARQLQDSSPCPNHLVSGNSAGYVSQLDPESRGLSRRRVRDRSPDATPDRFRDFTGGPSRILSPTADAGRPSKKARMDPPSTSGSGDAAAVNESGTHSRVSYTCQMPNARRGGGKTRGVLRVHPVAGADLSQENVEPDPTSGSSKTTNRHSSRSGTDRGTTPGSESRESNAADLSPTPSPTPPDTASAHKGKRDRKESKRRETVEERCATLYRWAKKKSGQPLEALPLAMVLYEPIAATQSQTDEGMAFCQIIRGCELVSKEEWQDVLERCFPTPSVPEERRRQVVHRRGLANVVRELVEADQELREAESRITSTYVVHHIIFRMELIRWTYKYHEITGKGRGGGILRQQLLEGLFQNSWEFGAAFDVEMNTEAREAQMKNLEAEFKKWKARHNSTVVKGRSLLHRAYIKFGALIFLDPFWNVDSLRKCKAGFAALMDAVYNASLSSRKGGTVAVCAFSARNAVAQQTVRNLVGYLGGEELEGAVDSFFHDFPYQDPV